MIPFYEPLITDKTKKYVQDAMDSGWISSKGPYINKFEEALADYLGCKYVITTNTGTAACHLCLLATKFNNEQLEVIVPNLTFVATANAVQYCNGNVHLCDIDRDTWLLDLDKYVLNINIRPTHVFVVDLFGVPANITDEQMQRNFCRGASLIQDSCQAFGSKIDGKHNGTNVDMACFSFFGNKTLTTGEGGAVITNSRKLYEKALLLRGQAEVSKYFHVEVGHNYRMTNIQAAIGLGQLENIRNILDCKRAIYESYQKQLNDFVSQKIPDNVTSNHWVYTILIDAPLFVQQQLKTHGIDSRTMFRPLNTMPMYYDHDDSNKYPISTFISKHGLMLPSYPDLPMYDINRICKIIKRYGKPIYYEEENLA
jgi:perosamine synthetase